jgi:hypothetical protein
MSLKPGSLVCVGGITYGIGLIEAISAEELDLIPQLRCLVLRESDP